MEALKYRQYIENILEKEFKGATFEPCTKGVNTWEELQQYRNKPLRIYSGFCDTSIFENSDTNILMRFLHDLTHLKYNLSFNYSDEIKTAQIHKEQFIDIGSPKIICDLIYLDTYAQIKYYEKYKRFVQNQKAFVYSCYNNGVEFTLNQEKNDN